MKEITTKICKKCQKEFLIIPQEQKFYKQKNLPAPVNCHECRRHRRQSLRNERKLYKRNCDKCKMELMSTYPENSPYTIYCEKCYFDEIG
jgi:hypothetical protein